ncbi:MAG: hypothetical protein JZU52_07985, partial [Lamprocystis purpurea]|nr:hypothetical protein [Lamprocystis purpurea]
MVKIENTIPQGGRTQGLGPHQSTRVSKNDAVLAQVCGQVSAAGGGARSALDLLARKCLRLGRMPLVAVIERQGPWRFSDRILWI